MAEAVLTTASEASVSDEVADILIRHQVDLTRLEADLRSRTRVELESLADDLARVIRRRGRLGRLIYRRARDISAEYFRRIADGMADAYARVASLEAGIYARALDTAIGVEVAVPRLSDNLVSTILKDSLIQGAPDSEWWSRQSRRVHQRFSDTVRQGLLLGRTTDQMTREWEDYVEVAKREAAAHVRTGINTVQNRARQRMAERNSDLIKGNTIVATLDMRTSDVCRARDGMAWTLDGEPMNERTSIDYPGPPPYHWNCRSAMVPVLKSYAEITNGKVKARVPRSTRASMDGQVPASMTYDQWFKRLPVDQQREILGPGKYKLWKRGKLSFTEMVDQTGNPLTIEELERKIK